MLLRVGAGWMSGRAALRSCCMGEIRKMAWALEDLALYFLRAESEHATAVAAPGKERFAATLALGSRVGWSCVRWVLLG